MEVAEEHQTDRFVKIPVCWECYYWIEKHIEHGSIKPAYLREKSWPYLKDKLIKLKDEDNGKCKSPFCKHKEKAGVSGSLPWTHMHGEDADRTGPNQCDCSCPRSIETHRMILAVLRVLEKLADDLAVARGEAPTAGYHAKVAFERLAEMPRWVSPEIYTIEGVAARADPSKRRPLCVVWCPSNFQCHMNKLLAYTPTNCDCTPMPCGCTNCILTHVQHSVEDYKAAVMRAERLSQNAEA